MTDIQRSRWTVSTASLDSGTWQVTLAPVGHAGDSAPRLKATHRSRPVALPDFERAETGWSMRLRLPDAMLSDGVQTLLLTDAETGAAVGSCHVSAGRVLDGDLLAEMSQLRAELDLLKRSFRKHCADSGE